MEHGGKNLVWRSIIDGIHNLEELGKVLLLRRVARMLGLEFMERLCVG